MKKLLLFYIICIPVIALAQIDGLKYFGQNPNEKIISKEVEINGVLQKVYLAKIYKDDNYKTLIEKFWYLIPNQHDLEMKIDPFFDTITASYQIKNGEYVLNKSSFDNQISEDIKTIYAKDILIAYDEAGDGTLNFNPPLLYLDGTIENGHYTYENGKIVSILINNSLWKPKNVKILKSDGTNYIDITAPSFPTFNSYNSY